MGRIIFLQRKALGLCALILAGKACHITYSKLLRQYNSGGSNTIWRTQPVQSSRSLFINSRPYSNYFLPLFTPKWVLFHFMYEKWKPEPFKLKRGLATCSNKFELKVAGCFEQTVNHNWNNVPQHCRVPVKRTSGSLTVNLRAWIIILTAEKKKSSFLNQYRQFRPQGAVRFL